MMAKTFLYGILLLAHGGSPSWNREVIKIQEELSMEVPTEAALGMAEVQSIQKAVDRLQSKGVSKIVAVPLFISSRSEVMEQTRYVLGFKARPSKVFVKAMASMPHSHGHGGDALARARIAVPVTLTPALDAHPMVGQIVLERARALSREPARETLILVGHGPVDEAANRSWLKSMRWLAAGVRRKGGFASAAAATIRDDSAVPIKAKAAAELRRLVAEARGRALVIPYLVARGGIEDHITGILKGLDYSWSGDTLCPHPNIARWARETARGAAEEMRFKGGSK
ncbi:MAG: hypothetical protein HY921_02220 [Elusimicrobia bacterium]|nr:hypothetical protein [Elusimicrobiota bacterium]